MKIRHAVREDAEQLAILVKHVEESGNMLFGPGERKISVESQRRRIESVEIEKTSAIFVAEQDGTLVGYLFAIGSNTNRTQHTIYLVIGVSEQFRGQGVGQRLFSSMEKWAIEKGIHRLELTVMTKNNMGIALYEKMGFLIEGTKKHSLYVDGNYVDEYYMAKLI